MTITYVTSGPWGGGTGTPNSAAQVDGNFWDLDQRVAAVNAALAEGKMIESVTYDASSMTFHFTDGTSETILLPVATLNFVGEWANSTPYTRANIVTVKGHGVYQVLQDHTTPASPVPFDPSAVDGSGNPLYGLWVPVGDTNYDAAIFVPGSVQRSAGELVFVGIANRSMHLDAGNAHAYAYLDVGVATGTNIVISIQKNRTEIGTVTFTVGAGIDGAGGQVGSVYVAAATDFAEGDRYALRVTQSNNPTPSGLSITLPFLRTDI